MPIGLKGNTDGSGAIQVGGSDAITLSTALNTTLAGSLNAPNTFGFKNRIINGDMRIDQRNAGASVTQTAALGYCLDRFYLFGSVTSKFTVQQNAASVTPPAGFSNYLGATSSAATSVGSGDTYFIGQRIEGLNTADLAWGTASAASVTLSFWVRSSLTGTFGGSIRNSAQNRSYPFTYTINSANTWEKETITIAGDTSGTWLTTNGVGIDIDFNLGTGATLSGTAGAWAAGNFTSATGAVSVVGTNGATFYVTGVQLERGSIATSFDVLDYGRSLIQCQRYLPCFNSTSTISTVCMDVAYDPSAIRAFYSFKVTTRVPPTGIIVSSASHFIVTAGASTFTPSAINFDFASNDVCALNCAVVGAVTGQAGQLYASSTSGRIQFTGCEL